MDSTGKARRNAAPGDIDGLVAKHRRWLETDGREGAPVSFRGMSCSGVDLTGVDLQRADLCDSRFRNAVLTGANLSEADLSGTDFQGADLSRTCLRDCVLRDTNFHDADLSGADLSGARGLLAGKLSGAFLSGTTLPATTAVADSLSNVTEASKTTQNLFASILLVCSYTWLTIASTTDPQLLNNAAPPSSRLPILGTDIPLVRFYVVAPLLLLCLYVYFHLCLQRLWEELGELPAVFPDGRPLDKKAYPWLMNVVVRAHLPRLRAGRSNLSRWQARMSIFLAWGLVPLTLMMLWVRYLRGHEPLGTILHVGAVAASLAVGVGFMYLASTTLKGSERRPFLWHKAWRDARIRSLAAGLIALVVLGTLSYGAINGVDQDSSERAAMINQSVSRFSPRRFVPPVFAYLGLSTFAHLDDSTMSIKPASWTVGTDADLESVKGADVTQRNLRHATAYKAFLVSAYFMDVDARGADFRESDLRKSDFRRADLRGTNFRGANLSGADFRYTDLTLTKLTEAIVEKANFREAKLTEAQLQDLKGKCANFSGADLRGADLTGADLAAADLSGADLRGVIGLTQQQLDLAYGSEETKLPDGLHTGLRLAKAP